MTRVSIRLLRASDRDAFLQMVRESRELHRPWAYPPERPDQFDELLSRCSRDDFACFVVIDDTSGELAGVFNISQIVRGSFQSAFLGYYGSVRHAGKGLMRAGLQEVLDYAFGPLALHRIEVNIQPDNAASIALARGAGFRLEGYSPRYLLIGGQWRDHERYALTVDERARADGRA
jgi:ribosomal-protein-alanine N-acetyltransferase